MIEITWDALTSITSSAGGDTLSSLSGGLYLDSTASEEYVVAAEVTRHPVEYGSEISDHVRPSLRELSFDCVVANNPTDKLLQLRSQQHVRDKLETLRVEGTVIELVAGSRTFSNLVITEIRERRSQDTGDGYFFTLNLKEIRRVTTEEVSAPSPRVSRARRTQEQGSTSAPSVSTTTMSRNPAHRQSALAGATDELRDSLSRLYSGGSA